MNEYDRGRRDALDQVIRELDALAGAIPIDASTNEEWRVRGILEARLWVECVTFDSRSETL